MQGVGRRLAGAAGGLLAAASVMFGASVASTRPAQADTTAGPWSAGQVAFVPIGTTTLSASGAGAYRGSLVVGPDGSGLGIVNVVGIEDYVLGISEVPPNWPQAALQAQAIAARTYGVWSLLTHRRTGGLNPQICASDACQVYRGMTRDAEPGDAAWAAAVRATSGQVLMYGNDVIEAVYGSSDGGQTTYGGVPWLPSVSDPDDRLSPEHEWSWSAPISDLAAPLQVPDGWSLTAVSTDGSNVQVRLAATDGSGRTVTDSLGSGRFHYLLNTGMGAPGGLPLPLPSWRFQVSTTGSDVSVRGWGFGNGMGMSQYGALGKADRGWGAGQILAAYYGPARPVTLAAGQVPSTIRVAVADGLSSTTVSATGPFLLEDGSGHVLATGSAGQWDVSDTSSGVRVVAPAGFANQAPTVSSAAASAAVTTPAVPVSTLGAAADPAGVGRRQAEAAPAGLAVPGRAGNGWWLAVAGLALLSVTGSVLARYRYLLGRAARSSISQA